MRNVTSGLKMLTSQLYGNHTYIRLISPISVIPMDSWIHTFQHVWHLMRRNKVIFCAWEKGKESLLVVYCGVVGKKSSQPNAWTTGNTASLVLLSVVFLGPASGVRHPVANFTGVAVFLRSGRNELTKWSKREGLSLSLSNTHIHTCRCAGQ